jgi:hypothetical protein
MLSLWINTRSASNVHIREGELGGRGSVSDAVCGDRVSRGLTGLRAVSSSCTSFVTQTATVPRQETSTVEPVGIDTSCKAWTSLPCGQGYPTSPRGTLSCCCAPSSNVALVLLFILVVDLKGFAYSITTRACNRPSQWPLEHWGREFESYPCIDVYLRALYARPSDGSKKSYHTFVGTDNFVRHA